MAWFNPDFLKFFAQLRKNNTREWFNSNRDRYEKEIKKAFQLFTSEMIRRISEKDKEIRVEPKDVIFRINRDVRFSKDKTPYQDHVSAAISKGGKKNVEYPGFYYSLNEKGVSVAMGSYMPTKEALYRIRWDISENLKPFSKLLKDKGFIKTFGKMDGEKNKILQEEFKDAAKLEPLIFNKQFFFWAKLPPSAITDSKLPDQLMKIYAAGNPVSEFLKKAILR